jgi:hypothetical protein
MTVSVLVACEVQLARLDEADALGMIGLLLCRAINRRLPGQRIDTARTMTDTLIESVEWSVAACDGLTDDTDAIGRLMRDDGIGFVEAVERLAKERGPQ